MRLRRRRNRAHSGDDGMFCRLCGRYMAIGEDGCCVLGHAVTAPVDDASAVDATSALGGQDDLPLASTATGTETAPAGRGQPAPSTDAGPPSALDELLAWDSPAGQQPPGGEPTGTMGRTAPGAAEETGEVRGQPAGGPGGRAPADETAVDDEGDEARDEDSPTGRRTTSGHHIGMLLAGALLSLAMFGVTVVLGALA
ncbi:hypothetical protein BH20ACT9_BH20ACT9_12180 [soil metagenome]